VLGPLWRLARTIKEAAEWWSIFATFGLLPSAALVYGVVNGWPLDVLLLYVIAGVAFMIVVVAEMPILQQLLSSGGPKAKIAFDPQDSNHVQRGTLSSAGASAGSAKVYYDESLYALGIVSLSAKAVTGCKLVLQASEPHNTSEQRLGRSMKVRDDPDDQSRGEFTLNPGDGARPSIYVEVLQELVPRHGGPANIRLQYASTHRGQPNWFTNRSDHLLTFRLEGGLSPVQFRLHVSYDANAQRWRVEPAG
jgi:hypothetical protein